MTTDALNFDRLNTYVAEGRLIRGAWTGTDAQARDTACLLAALYPKAGENQSADACPAALMPPWLAHLTVWIDDNGTLEAWPEHVRRYAAVIGGVVALDAPTLDALSRRIRVLIVREAVSHVTVDEWGVRAACEQTTAALESGYADKIDAARDAAWAARDAAWAARDAARDAAADAAWAAADAARDAAWDAATDAAADAAWAAADAARVAAWAAWAAARDAAADAAWAAARDAAWDAATDAAADAARVAAADRLIDGMLTAMEEATR